MIKMHNLVSSKSFFKIILDSRFHVGSCSVPVFNIFRTIKDYFGAARDHLERRYSNNVIGLLEPQTQKTR